MGVPVDSAQIQKMVALFRQRIAAAEREEAETNRLYGWLQKTSPSLDNDSIADVIHFLADYLESSPQLVEAATQAASGARLPWLLGPALGRAAAFWEKPQHLIAEEFGMLGLAESAYLTNRYLEKFSGKIEPSQQSLSMATPVTSLNAAMRNLIGKRLTVMLDAEVDSLFKTPAARFGIALRQLGSSARQVAPVLNSAVVLNNAMVLNLASGAFEGALHVGNKPTPSQLKVSESEDPVRIRVRGLVGRAKTGDAFAPRRIGTRDDAASASSATAGGPGDGKPPDAAPQRPVITLYPDIKASNPNPLSGSQLTVDVCLAHEPMDGVAGAVNVPNVTPYEVRTLRVHLLMGEISKWEMLEFSIADPKRKPAHFKLEVPRIAGERKIVSIRVNFYLDSRWCGEGVRNLEVRRDAAVKPLDKVPSPEVSEWCRQLTLEPGAKPPDLIVRIQRQDIWTYVWTCVSPHMEFAKVMDPAASRSVFAQGAEDFVRSSLKPLAGKQLGQLDIANIEGVGEFIHGATPKAFREAYWALWQEAARRMFTFESVLFITDEPYVPWELMRIPADPRAPGATAEFLSIRHDVGRWLASDSSRMVQSIDVSRVAVSASDYVGVKDIPELPWAMKEKHLLTEKYRANPVELKSSALLAFLESRGADAVHFACHGQMSIAAPLNSQLILEDNPENLRPTTVNRSEVRSGLGSAHPLIFINACEVGGAAALLSMVVGFPAAFLAIGATAVVSPLWAVHDESARNVAEMFYAQAFASPGIPLGRVLRDIRSRWREKRQLTWLAYVLYGDPLVRVRYSPSVST